MLNAIQGGPSWLAPSIQYLTIMGSRAYGADTETSDVDLYGFCVPPRHVVYPHLAGVIPGFGDQGQRFEQYAPSDDITVYSIIKYFKLCAESNPNMIESLFVPEDCIQHITDVGRLVRKHRHKFLSKQAIEKFKGFAYSQITKLESKRPVGKRAELVEKFGYDTKFAYHMVRLLDEAEQILTTGDLHLRKSSDLLVAVRSGEWSLERVYQHFRVKLSIVERAGEASKLPLIPDMEELKALLLNCLEIHYNTKRDGAKHASE